MVNVNRIINLFIQELLEFSTMRASYTREFKLKAIEMAKESKNVLGTTRQLGWASVNLALEGGKIKNKK